MSAGACTNPQCSHFGGRPSAHRRGYGAEHQAKTRAAIEAEPWCHTRGGCPHDDAGTEANPLTGGHLRKRSECRTDAEWNALPRIPQCARCNSGHQPL